MVVGSTSPCNHPRGFVFYFIPSHAVAKLDRLATDGFYTPDFSQNQQAGLM